MRNADVLTKRAVLFSMVVAVGCGSTVADPVPTDSDTGTDTSGAGDSDSAGDGGDEADGGDGPGRKTELAGVNLAGAEFGSEVPGVYSIDYTYPKLESVDYFMSKGMNVFRVPFGWERLQREVYGELTDSDLRRLKELVFGITERGAYAILDPHNYARYYGELVGSSVDDEAFADFWARMATEFMADERVIFGLMNEPHDMETEQWFTSATAAAEAIRATGAENLILLPGNGWTGAHSWSASYYGTPNRDAVGAFSDPGDNFAIEVHQYLDSNSSGTGEKCVSETVGAERLTGVTEWARENGYRLFLGEFGAGTSDVCAAAVDNMLTYMGDNAEVWLGWSWWAAGPWWGDYFMSIEPDAQGDKPQMSVLERQL